MWTSVWEEHTTLPLFAPNIFYSFGTISFLQKAYISTWFTKAVKNSPLSKERIPRAFSDNNLKLMLFSPIIRRKNGKQRRKTNSCFGYERGGSGKITWAKCCNIVFIKCRLDNWRKMPNEIGLIISDQTQQFLFLFRIPYISEEKYGNDVPVCQIWNSRQTFVDRKIFA